MTMPLRALLVDDEAPALQRLKQLLQEHGDVDVVGCAGSVQEALVQLKSTAVDLVFLDLRMPGADGSALLPHLPEQVAVIFTTAHSDYAVSAFDAGAHDYLLKPFNHARLALSLDRLKQRRQAAEQQAQDTEAKGFWAEDNTRNDGSLLFVAFSDVLWLEALQNYTHVERKNGKPLMIKRTMKEWEEQLPRASFVRLDRSIIVQIREIKRCDRRSRSCTLLRFGNDHNPPTLAVGATAATRLNQTLSEERRTT